MIKTYQGSIYSVSAALLSLMFLLLVSTSALAKKGLYIIQQHLKGKVTDKSGNPLPGVSIFIKGTEKGTQTDFDGKYFISVEESDVLVFTYVGMKAQEIPVEDKTTLDIVMQEDVAELEGVVVVGYGRQKKSILTSSVTQVKGEDLSKEPVLNVVQALQGKAAGVQIIASDAPGQESTVIVRGLGTVQGGRNPLYVVDGVLTNTISNINSSDIKSMNILKDAASLAIYGNRGANGVIIITTKKGTTGKVKISFDVYSGIRDVLSRVKMADANSFVTYSNEAILRDLLNDDDPSNDGDTSDFFPSKQKYNTNWLEVITRIGFVTNYNLSLSGGTEKLTTFFSAGLNDEKGVLKGNDFSRLTLRNNLDYKINDKLSFSHNLNVQLANATPQNYKLFTEAYKQAPTIPEKDASGKFGSSTSINNVANPAVGASGLYHEDKNKIFKFQGAFKLNYELIEDLNFTSRFSIEAEYGRFFSFRDRLGRFLASNPTNKEADFEGGVDNPAKTRLVVTNTNSYRWFSDNFVTYKKTLMDSHTFKTTVGVTAEEGRSEYLKGTRNNVPKSSNLRFNLKTGDEDNTQLSDGSLSVLNRLYSYIARVHYDYENKYLFNASFRRDGSSKFKRGNKFGNFFAVSAGWVVSKENFMDDSPFDVLKLRTSYGHLGNQNVAFNVLTATTGSGGFYPLGASQALHQGITIAGIIQEDLSWEVTKEFNIGAELSLFNHKLTGEIDYYKRVNSNATLQITLPDVIGYEPFNSHVGEVENTGIEVAFNWSDVIGKDFNYRIGGNLSYNKNELTKVTNPFFNKQRGGFIDNGQYTKKIAVGQPLGSFFLYDIEGIDDKGEFIYKDINKNGTIDEGDRQFFGSYIPKYILSFNIGFTYKNFDCNIDIFGNLGGKVYNGKKAQRFGNENIEQSVFNNRWTSKSPSKKAPIASNDVPLSSTYYLESGDFFRINNITLGYTIPIKFFSKVRIYAAAKNPFIFKKFSGFTPELSGNEGGNPLGTAGIELDAYPTLQSFYIGINTSF